MTDDRITFLKALSLFANLFDPACVFVSHDVRQFHIHFLAPYPLDHMQVSPANTGSSNADDYIRASCQFRFFYFLQNHEVRVSKRSVIFMKYGGFHNLREQRRLSYGGSDKSKNETTAIRRKINGISTCVCKRYQCCILKEDRPAKT